MKISTRLRYNAAASIILVALLFVLLFHFSYSMKVELDKFGYANELLHKTSTLIVLTHEYLIKREQRSERQWHYQFQDIMETIARHEQLPDMIQVKENLEMLRRQYERLKNEIETRKALNAQSADVEEINRFRFSERLLSDQMQISAQRALSHVFNITAAAEQKLSILRTRSSYTVLCFGALMALITLANALATLKRIARPLTSLVAQVNLLEKVNFATDNPATDSMEQFSKNDEVGRLWIAFADMKIRLARAFGKINRELKEREAAEAEIRERNVQLKQLQNMLESIVNSMPSMLVGIDGLGRIAQWNAEAEKLTGVAMAQAEGMFLRQLVPALDPWVEKMPRAIQALHPMKAEKQPLEICGNRIFADITLFPLVSGKLPGAVIRVDDVSERVAMDEIIIQSEKMLSLGGLAAGVAHEINNPLAGILQNIQVVMNRFSPAFLQNQRVARECQTSMEAINTYLEARGLKQIFALITDSGERAAAIVENLLSFSRKSHSQPEQHNLSELIDKTLELAASDYDLKRKYDFRKIRILREYDASVPTVMCDGGKIQQVMFNLLRNASQAMARENRPDKTPQITVRITANSEMATIEVEDNGPGVPKDLLAKIFEPFFTTKEVGEGTGLGLFVAYFIVTNNHQGGMRVESPPGQGARFIVQLPLRQQISPSN
ncbi:MAG: PAS domain S-box protein [Desulfatibacillum sp.]|nr:PAS domain S-box protein [Desulfatibacillum sp.]